SGPCARRGGRALSEDDHGHVLLRLAEDRDEDSAADDHRHRRRARTLRHPRHPAPAVPAHRARPGEGTPARATYDLIDEHFGPGFNGPLIMTSQIVTSDDPLDDVERIEDRIEDVDGVDQVVMATPNRDATTALFQII